jgi:hypothetical protein
LLASTLSLSTGTYFLNNLDVEPNAKLSCSSGSGQIVVNVKVGVIFRGSIIEKTGGRPKFFQGVFGTHLFPLRRSSDPRVELTLKSVR